MLLSMPRFPAKQLPPPSSITPSPFPPRRALKRLWREELRRRPLAEALARYALSRLTILKARMNFERARGSSSSGIVADLRAGDDT